MPQVAIVVDDLKCLAVLDPDFSGVVLAAFREIEYCGNASPAKVPNPIKKAAVAGTTSRPRRCQITYLMVI